MGKYNIRYVDIYVGTYLQRFVNERDQIWPTVGYGRVFDEFQKTGISYFFHEYAIRVNDALAVLVIGSVDLINFPYVRLARVPGQHFPVVVDYTLQGVFGGAQQLRYDKLRGKIIS